MTVSLEVLKSRRHVTASAFRLSRLAAFNAAEVDRTRARSAVAHSLYRRRLAAYCQDNRVDEASLTAEIKDEILAKAKAMYEEFLTAIAGKKVSLDKSQFELSTPGSEASAAETAEEDTSADE